MPAFARHLLVVLGLLLGSARVGAEVLVVTGLRSNPVSLDRERIEAIYLGRTIHLTDGTELTPLDLPNGPTRDEFYLKLTGKNPVQIRAHWSRMVFTGRALPPREAESPAQVRLWLLESPDRIGYVDRNDNTAGLRILLRLP